MKVLEKVSNFAGNTFAVWVILFAILAFSLPNAFLWIGPYISLLLGIIMFGMGLTLTLDDFKGIMKTPKSVVIGILAQYTIMPLIAFGLAHLFQLPPEIAVGIILVGCCPGGTASNVMTFLARGNTALSVTVTAFSTILAPILTPTLTLLFASKWLPVSAGDMFISIVQIVLIPIVLGVIIQMLFKEQVEKSVKALPLISVIGIVAVVTAVVAANTEAIATTGLLIFTVVILHNIFGLFIGYLMAKALRLNYRDQKAVSIEVGMQNSGLGSALAMAHFSPIAAVPSAIFSVWHNISGSLLATWWAKRSDKEETPPSTTIDKQAK